MKKRVLRELGKIFTHEPQKVEKPEEKKPKATKKTRKAK
jgi:hypothetical protein